MWDLPGSGIEPVFCALADGFLTTAPPGKSRIVLLYNALIDIFFAFTPYHSNYKAKFFKDVVWAYCFFVFPLVQCYEYNSF